MLKELIEDLRPFNRSDIAEKTGLSLSSIEKILCGANSNPTIKTVEKLRRYADEFSKDGGKA